MRRDLGSVEEKKKKRERGGGGSIEKREPWAAMCVCVLAVKENKEGARVQSKSGCRRFGVTMGEDRS